MSKTGMQSTHKTGISLFNSLILMAVEQHMTVLEHVMSQCKSVKAYNKDVPVKLHNVACVYVVKSEPAVNTIHV